MTKRVRELTKDLLPGFFSLLAQLGTSAFRYDRRTHVTNDLNLYLPGTFGKFLIEFYVTNLNLGTGDVR